MPAVLMAGLPSTTPASMDSWTLSSFWRKSGLISTRLIALIEPLCTGPVASTIQRWSKFSSNLTWTSSPLTKSLRSQWTSQRSMMLLMYSLLSRYTKTMRSRGIGLVRRDPPTRTLKQDPGQTLGLRLNPKRQQNDSYLSTKGQIFHNFPYFTFTF